MEEENYNDKIADSVAEPSAVSESAEKNDKEVEICGGPSRAVQPLKGVQPKSLKAASKISKNVAVDGSSGKGKQVGVVQSVRRRYRKRKKKQEMMQGKEEGIKDSNEDVMDGKPRGEDVLENVVNGEHSQNGKEKENEERIAMEDTENGKEKEVREERIAEENRSQKNPASDGNPDCVDKDSRKEKDKGKMEAEGKIEEKGKSQSVEKEEKLGGLIFMCSAKTKPDCFKYRLMGVTMNKKDVVMAVKPGLKLFLYDFDLKLMYGIYEASSKGGIKLEPKAFGGSFPAQVRFRVYKDCFPIPESVFKKAMKENYDRNNKFKTELSVQQVRKLSELFKPAEFQSVQSAAVPRHSPSIYANQDRELLEAAREPLVHSDRDAFPRADHELRNFPVISHSRDRRIDYWEGARRREEIPHDLFMSGQEPRTYNLQGERRNLSSPKQITSSLDPYQRDGFINQTDPMYIDAISLQREAVVNPLYMHRREFPAYNPVSAPASASGVVALDSFSRYPSYNYPYGSSSSDSYLPLSRRDEASTGSYHFDGRSSYLVDAGSSHWGVTDKANRLQPTYTADALSNYNDVHSYNLANQDMAPPVSSRYSFDGPPITYR